MPADEVELQPCPNCGGQGEIEPLMSDLMDTPNAQPATCPHCRGLKFVPK